MEYQEVLDFIGGAEKFGKKLGLNKVRHLMKRLGNPQETLKTVHIAGTNGKGSTAAFLSEILQTAGYTVGLFTSPFLYEFNERIRVNGQMIDDVALCSAMERVKNVADKMHAEGEEYPTEFELITAAAFCHFAEVDCDIVVLETGLGGRFDATNVISSPEVSVITSIGLDHTQYLGNTLADIAFEKSGIIKQNRPCVCYGLQAEEVFSVIQSKTQEEHSELYTWSQEEIVKCEVCEDGNSFVFRGVCYRTKLRGEYQIYNAITAIITAKVLQKTFFSVTEETIRTGIENAKWSGRMEPLSKQPLIFADGSHNPDGVRAFSKSAKKIAGNRKTEFVVAMMKDKDCKNCLQELSVLTDHVIVTTLPFPRAATAEELAQTASDMFTRVETAQNCKEALQMAEKNVGNHGCVFVLGSLYLIGEVKKVLEKKS